MSHSSHQIAKIIATPIAVPDPPLLNCAGIHAPYALRIILEVVTEGGILGVSEIPGNERSMEAIRSIQGLLIGKDVLQLNQILKIVRDEIEEPSDERGGAPHDARLAVHIFSAIEVACLDILGKMLDVGVVDLLGGRMRERVPFAAYLFYKRKGAGGTYGYETQSDISGWEFYRQAEGIKTEDLVAQAISMVETFGNKSIKLKGGPFVPEKEVGDMQALYDHFGPDVPLRYDPNAAWSYETGVMWGKKLEGVLQYLEDPVKGQKNMANLRKEVNIPLATNMCTTSFSQIPNSVRVHSEDIILSDHHFWGGLRASIELYRICKTFGRGFSMHSNSHLGISMAAMIHLGAALPEFDYDLDTHYPWQNEDVIVGGKIPIEDGSAEIPKGPGLGVEIDRDQLKKLHQNYIDCGITERDDEVEMQKLDPSWKFVEERY